MTTTLIYGGKIIDGLGNDEFMGQILINKGKIEAVLKENEPRPQTDSLIDASGSVISPGFIDMHSHMDWVLPIDDQSDSILKCFLEQGVTTVITGNCGMSVAPITAKTSRSLLNQAEKLLSYKPLKYTWSSVSDYLEKLEETEPVLNIAQLVGHTMTRLAVADTLRGPLKPDESKRCLDELKRSFDAGACGVSFGLGYDTALFSPNEEIEEFCRVAQKEDKIATVHMKAYTYLSPAYSIFTPKPHNIRALKEIINIAQKTGVRLQISHLVFWGRKAWKTAYNALELIENASKEGVDIQFDAFPYTFGNSTIDAVLPLWVIENRQSVYQSFWKRMRFKIETKVGFSSIGYTNNDLVVMDPVFDDWDGIKGLSISEIADKWKTTPLSALIKINQRCEGATTILYQALSGEKDDEKVLETVLSHKLCLFETDSLVKSQGVPNPAALGTFPRILGKYVRERNLFSMKDAINRMTSSTAKRFGLKDRGVLVAGKAADIVVFNPLTVSDHTDGKPTGIKHVFLNGSHVVENGSYLRGTRYGKVLGS